MNQENWVAYRKAHGMPIGTEALDEFVASYHHIIKPVLADSEWIANEP